MGGVLGVIPARPTMQFDEPLSAKIAWLQLRNFTDDPALGLTLFSGSRAERNRKFREFTNYVRQARTYWDAATRVEGSASALPYYYALLNLAKAELLQTHASSVIGQPIHHGLSQNTSTTTSIRGDRVESRRGVFSLLFQKRVGAMLPVRTSFRVINLLSLIPEIALEVSEFGRSRPWSVPVYQSIAMDQTSAWSVIAFVPQDPWDAREPVARKLAAHYEEVDWGRPMPGIEPWRNIFSVSSRNTIGGFSFRQARRAHSLSMPDGTSVPDVQTAALEPWRTLGVSLALPGTMQSEFMITPTIAKSAPLVVPLNLARYAAMFYLSSLVRYTPSSLDPARQGKQAWLMDSFVNEVPLLALTDAVDGITNRVTYFHPSQRRL